MKVTLHFFFTLVITVLLTSTLNATTYTATTTGAWSASGTWDANGVPDGTGTGDVVINNGVTVTIDANFTINNLTIGGGTSGALQFNSTTSIASVVNGNISVQAGATFRCLTNTIGTASPNGGLAHTLNVKGNFTNNGASFGFRNGNAGTTLSVCNLTLSGTTNTTLTTNATYTSGSNAGMFNSVTINKTGGGKVILGSNFVMSGGSSTGPIVCNTTMTFVSGLIETGSYIWICLNTTGANVVGYSSASYINGTMGRGMSSGAGSKDFPVGDGNGYRLFNLHETSGAGSGAGHYAIVKCIPGNANTGTSVLNGGIDRVSQVRYYQVGYNNSIAGAATLSFDLFKVSYGADDGVIPGNTNLRVAYSTNTRATWTMINQTAPHTTVAAGMITPDAITPYSLSPGNFIYVALADVTGGENPLPVELSSFTSNVNGRDISLNWTTKTEKNSNKFDVERLSNQTWTAIGSVKASVLSNSPKQYSFTDMNLQAGMYQYRLKMIDNDGSFNYSKIVETEVSLPKNFELSQNYPNPFNPLTKINYNLAADSKVTLEVYSISGERIAQLVNGSQPAGFYSVNFASSSLNKLASSGVYFYRIIAVDNATGNQFSSIKKMMILK